MPDVLIQVQHAAELILEADGLVVAAGAGMGVDSGLPDFRGNEGFWKAYPALAQANLIFSRVASPATFERDPRLAWGFYGHRLNLYRETVPHQGFHILSKWAHCMPHGAAVFTSNVDGQFQKAGMTGPIHECHGSIHHLQCSKPCCDNIWDAEGFKPQVDKVACRLLSDLPICPSCGALARPNVLMFSDHHWLPQRNLKQEADLSRWLSAVERPVVIEIGAGTAIPSVRFFSHSVLQEHGGRLIRINPREFAVPTKLDVGVSVGALEALTAIDEQIASNTQARETEFR